MKIQCPCGAKYSIDVSPEMAQGPVRFVCQQCGLDSSDAVNAMIRQDLSEAPQVGILIPPSDVSAVAQEPASPLRPRIHVQAHSAAAAEPTDAPQFCSKHPGHAITHQCLVCNKPMCPQCMELFGYVCSPYCRNKAEAQGMDVPKFAGQRTVVEAREWRKISSVTGAIVAVVLVLLGVWFWYAWYGSRPGVVFSVTFAGPAIYGESRLCGGNQLVVLHDGTLARYDVKTKKQIWSRQLGSGSGNEISDLEGDLAKLYVRDTNIWISTPDNLVRYDWAGGNPVQNISLKGRFGGFVRQGDDLLALTVSDSGSPVVLHVNLATTDSRTEEIARTVIAAAGKTSTAASAVGTGRQAQGPATAGLPVGKAGADQGRPLDPARVQEQMQHLSFAARIALPAILAINMEQDQALEEINGDENPQPRKQANNEPHAADYSLFLPNDNGCILFNAHVLEEKFIAHDAMKAPPKKSVLDGNLNVTQSDDVANELLNEMQRNRGGGRVLENDSRYQVTVRSADGNAPDWSSEVTGPPELFPLKTINVITAGTTLIVLDKSNKKLWQSTLTYPVKSDSGIPGQDSPFGEGPCVQHGDRLYVFDQAVLTAFDAGTGNVYWRLPSVGVAGLFFDDHGMLYVNTTTASPDAVKYSRQIDVTQKTRAVILKVDAKSGKILWNVDPGGFIAYVSGKFIYTSISYDSVGEFKGPMQTGLETSSFMKIKRLDPEDGSVLWEYYQPRAPLDIQFKNNTIGLVFRKDAQVLKFMSL